MAWPGRVAGSLDRQWLENFDVKFGLERIDSKNSMVKLGLKMA
jgi:hypothetical protein